jgi:hypothetical protein
MTDLGGPKRNEPQRHRDTEKRKVEKKRDTAKEARMQEKQETDPSSFLVSWVP